MAKFWPLHHYNQCMGENIIAIGAHGSRREWGRPSRASWNTRSEKPMNRAQGVESLCTERYCVRNLNCYKKSLNFKLAIVSLVHTSLLCSLPPYTSVQLYIQTFIIYNEHTKWKYILMLSTFFSDTYALFLSNILQKILN